MNHKTNRSHTIHAQRSSQTAFNPVSPKVKKAACRNAQWRGAAVLFGGAAAIAAKILASNPSTAAWFAPSTFTLCVYAALGLTAFFLISMLLKKSSGILSRILMTSSCISFGILAGWTGHDLTVFQFSVFLGLGLLLIEIVVYLLYKCKYDPVDIDTDNFHPMIWY